LRQLLLDHSSLRVALLYWAPMAAWMVAIFALSSLTSTAIESSAPAAAATRSFPSLVNQVTAHLVEFGVLAILVYRALSQRWPAATPIMWITVIAVTVAYGASDEYHQSFVRGRHPSWMDVGYDAAGAVIGVSLAAAWSWLRSRVHVASV
jgi:VanZ family protein